MTAVYFLIRVIVVLIVVGIFLYVIVPDFFKNKKKEVPVKEPTTPLDDLVKQSEEIVAKKEEIRGETEKTQKKVEIINENLKK